MTLEATSPELHMNIMLENHLRYNIFPSQIGLINFATEAIRLVNDGQGDDAVEAMQDGKKAKLIKNGETESSVTANEMVENFKLEFFLNMEDEDFDGDGHAMYFFEAAELDEAQIEKILCLDVDLTDTDTEHRGYASYGGELDRSQLNDIFGTDFEPDHEVAAIYINSYDPSGGNELDQICDIELDF